MQYTLYELNEYIRRVLALNMRGTAWISCEISTIKMSGGHYYLELVEKKDEVVIAQASAILWKKKHKELVAKLGFELPGLLRSGIQVLASVRVHFHEKYGLKLHIEDLDPAYTLGQMERKRRDIIQKLAYDDLLQKNAQIALPTVLQRIAVISSAQAAGWRDFEEHLEQNPFDYRVGIQLFPARVQGEFLEKDMLKQLTKIEKRYKDFDAVVIIRGGGSRLDLSWFDSYELGKRIAHFPLPVLTGIGHETDETITDLVAHTALKTPTAVAEKILMTFRDFEAHLNGMQQYISSFISRKIQSENHRLDALSQRLSRNIQFKLQHENQMLHYLESRVSSLATRRLDEAEKDLAHLENTIRILSPEFALTRGFSMTSKNGQIIDNLKDIRVGDEIETQFKGGKIKSVVSEN